MERISEQQKLFVGIAIGVLIGVVLTTLGFSILERNKEGNADVTSEVVSKAEVLINGTLVEEEDRIDVQDQTEGIVVRITNVTLQSAGWVAIHETADGTATNILGAARFDKGSSSGFMELLRGTESGGLYYARLYSDNGDRAFDPETDLLVVDINGSPIQDSFFVTE